MDAASLLPANRIRVRAEEHGSRRTASLSPASSRSMRAPSPATPYRAKSTPGEEVSSRFSGTAAACSKSASAARAKNHHARARRAESQSARPRNAAHPVERLMTDRVATWFLPALLLAAGLAFFFTRAAGCAPSPVLDRGVPLRSHPGNSNRHGRGDRRTGPPAEILVRGAPPSCSWPPRSIPWSSSRPAPSPRAVSKSSA